MSDRQYWRKGISSAIAVAVVFLFVTTGVSTIAGYAQQVSGPSVAQPFPTGHASPQVSNNPPVATANPSTTGAFNYVVPSTPCIGTGHGIGDVLDAAANTLFLNQSCSFTGQVVLKSNVSIGYNTIVAINNANVSFNQTSWHDGSGHLMVRSITANATANLMIYNSTIHNGNDTGINSTLPIVLDPYYTQTTCSARNPIRPILEVYNSQIGTAASNNTTVNWGSIVTYGAEELLGGYPGWTSPNYPWVCEANGIVYMAHSTIYGSVEYGTSTAYFSNDNIYYDGPAKPYAGPDHFTMQQVMISMFGAPGSYKFILATDGALTQAVAVPSTNLVQLCPNDNVSGIRDATYFSPLVPMVFEVCSNGPIPSGMPGAIENSTIINGVSVSTQGYAYSAISSMAYFPTSASYSTSPGTYTIFGAVDYAPMPIASNLTFSATQLTISSKNGGTQSSLWVSTAGATNYGEYATFGENISLNGVTVANAATWNETPQKDIATFTQTTPNGASIVTVDNATAYIVTDGSGNLTVDGLLMTDNYTYATGLWIGNVTSTASVTNSIFHDTATKGTYVPQFIFGLQGMNTTIPKAVLDEQPSPLGQFSIAYAFNEINGLVNFTLAGDTFYSTGFNATTLPGLERYGISAFMAELNGNAEGSAPNIYEKVAGIKTTVIDDKFTISGTGPIANADAYGVIGLSNEYGEAAIVGNTMTITNRGMISAIQDNGGGLFQWVFPYLNLTGNTISVTNVVNNSQWMASLHANGYYGAIYNAGGYVYQGTAIDLFNNQISFTGKGYPSTTGPAYWSQGVCSNSPAGFNCTGVGAAFFSLSKTGYNTTIWNMQGNNFSLNGGVVGFGGQFSGYTPTYGFVFKGTLSPQYTAPKNGPVGWTVPQPLDSLHYLDLPLGFQHSPMHPNILGNTISATGGAILFDGLDISSLPCNFNSGGLGACTSGGYNPGSNGYAPYWAEDLTDLNLYIGPNTWTFDSESVFSFMETNLEVIDTHVPTVILASYYKVPSPYVGAPLWNLFINSTASRVLIQPGASEMEGLAYGSDVSWDTNIPLTGCDGKWGTWELASPAFSSVYSKGSCDRAWLFTDFVDYSFPTGSQTPNFNWSINYNGTTLMHVPSTSHEYMALQHTDGNIISQGIQTTEQIEMQYMQASSSPLTAGAGAIGINPQTNGGALAQQTTIPRTPDAVALYYPQLSPSYEYDEYNLASTGPLLMGDPATAYATSSGCSQCNQGLGSIAASSIMQPVPWASELPTVSSVVYFAPTYQTVNISWSGGTGVMMFGQPIMPVHYATPLYNSHDKLIGGDNFTVFPQVINASVTAGFNHPIYLEPAIIPAGAVGNFSVYNATGGYAIFGEWFPESFGPAGNTPNYVFQVGEAGYTSSAVLKSVGITTGKVVQAAIVRPLSKANGEPFYLEPLTLVFSGLMGTATSTTYPYGVWIGNNSATNYIQQIAPAMYSRTGAGTDSWFASLNGTFNITISGTAIDNSTFAVIPDFTTGGLGPIGSNLDNSLFWLAVGVGVFLTASSVILLYRTVGRKRNVQKSREA